MPSSSSAPGYLPLSLYIHIPWCVAKCPYCDFNSHAVRGSIPEIRYVHALIQDLNMDIARFHLSNRTLHSIFIGGGTPSLLSEQALTDILQGIDNLLHIPQSTEITLEANPGTVDQTHFAGYKRAGINRLSLGIQSFQTEKLKALGRIHSAKEAQMAIKGAQTVGFENINLDLMHGLPGQSVQDARADVQTALSFQVPHISWYQLTLEPNTAFYHNSPVLPNELCLYSIQTQGSELLYKAGFQNYEISAFCKRHSYTQTHSRNRYCSNFNTRRGAREDEERGVHTIHEHRNKRATKSQFERRVVYPDYRCKHNLNYWQFGDYLGIGAGAHGKITDISTKQVIRTRKRRHPKAYLDETSTFMADTKVVPRKELALEFMMNALRLYTKIPMRWFEARTFLQFSDIQCILEHAQTQGLLTYTKKHLITTKHGKRYLNNLLALFMPN